MTMEDCARLFDPSLISVKDLNISFCLSMQTNIKDIENEKHLQMSRSEFIELIARVADKIFDDGELCDKIGNLVRELTTL